MTAYQRPIVSVLYSAAEKGRSASRDFALYFGASLALGGYSSVKMVSFNGKTSGASGIDKASETPPVIERLNRRKRYSVPPAHVFSFSDGSVVSKADMIVICVANIDTSACAEYLKKVLPTDQSRAKDNGAKTYDGVILSLQSDVRSFSTLEAILSNCAYTLLHGAVGIMISRTVLSPKEARSITSKLPSLSVQFPGDLNKEYAKRLENEILAKVRGDPGMGTGGEAAVECLQPIWYGSIVVERLKRDKADVAGKFIDLLQTAGVHILFDRALTVHTWGAAIFSSPLDAVAALTTPTRTAQQEDSSSSSSSSSSNGSTSARLPTVVGLWNRLSPLPNRIVIRAMMAECSLAMSTAARRGKWRPDFQSCSPLLTIDLFRMVLLSPSVLWSLLSWSVFAHAGYRSGRLPAPSYVDLLLLGRGNTTATTPPPAATAQSGVSKVGDDSGSKKKYKGQEQEQQAYQPSCLDPLRELLSVGSQHSVDMPVTAKVFAMLEECSSSSKGKVKSKDSQALTAAGPPGIAPHVLCERTGAMGGKDWTYFYAVQLVMVASIVLALAVLALLFHALLL